MVTTKLLLFDCDSTLSSIEGIDELARVRGLDTFRQVEAMTNDAMNGIIPLESVFARRLEIIKPTRADLEAVGRRYLETMEPTARATVSALALQGWTPMIVSGGFRQAIQPLAQALGILRIEAVDLFFNPDGSYCGFDKTYPTTRSGGKPQIVVRLRSELDPVQVVMVGDGASDMEVKPVVDLFVGFGRYVARETVRRGAHHFITALDELNRLLAT